MPKRIQRRRVKGWKMPAGAVSVTRPGVFGNPFVLKDPVLPGDRERAVSAFRRWLNGTIPGAEAQRSRLLARLQELRGKDLACFCAEGATCHADVLLELANRTEARP